MEIVIPLDKNTQLSVHEVARANAMTTREPCQVRNEAALSDICHVPLVTWHFNLFRH